MASLDMFPDGAINYIIKHKDGMWSRMYPKRPLSKPKPEGSHNPMSPKTIRTTKNSNFFKD